jgi:midasin
MVWQEAAARRGLLLAYIALDNPASTSLMDLRTVSLVNGGVTLTSYLDTFPFPYYIVLRDLAALPRTLADLLRQWVELSTLE